jgi:DNA-directed RNA polymerase subunit RPC12/RpoP
MLDEKKGAELSECVRRSDCFACGHYDNYTVDCPECLKALDEMAKLTCPYFTEGEYYGYKYESCWDCKFEDSCTIREKYYLLYKANYRRQIQAEWKSGYENGQYGYFCTNCKAGFVGENAEWIAKEHDYCPKCGAKMKGGA